MKNAPSQIAIAKADIEVLEQRLCLTIGPVQMVVNPGPIPELPAIDWMGSRVNAVPGEYIIRVDDSLTTELKAELASRGRSFVSRDRAASAEVESLVSSLPFQAKFNGYLGSPNTFSVAVDPAIEPASVAESFRAKRGVVGIDPNLLGTLASAPVTANPDNPSRDWWQDRIRVSGTSSTNLGAWDYSTGSESTVVAVIDSGVQFTVANSDPAAAPDIKKVNGGPNVAISVHEDLAGNIFNNYADDDFDGNDDDGNGYIDDGIG
ncbi:MAG: hypothetical protein KatS3mg082_3154 [Nitrospiraceae bacterium]|nr:MAG: hypothetical protein KatS3mg082_3154 [Nitrospiraceae bacterium]